MDKINRITISLAVFCGLYISSLYNYLLFHSIAEGFAVVIACSIFMLAWNSRTIVDNAYILFLGIAYLFIGVIDFLHTIGFLGMGVFQHYGANLGTQLWIGARYFESISLFIAPLIMDRELKHQRVLAVYGAFFTLFVLSIFTFDIFPVCFIEGSGLTPFKKNSEYIITLILAASIFIMHRKKDKFDPDIFKLLVASIAVTILSELAFTLYIHAYGLPNLIGHFLKIISFYLIYKAIIGTGMTKPYALLFRDLKQSEESLRTSEAKLRSLYDAMTEGVAIHDIVYDDSGRAVDYRITDINPAYEKITGIDRNNVIGKTASELYGTGTPPYFDIYEKVAESGAPAQFDTYFPPMNKHFSISAFSPDKGKFATVFEDITGHKQAEEKLNTYLNQLEKANRQLSDFAYIVSHDLREPLRALNSLANWIAKDYADTFDESGREKLRMLTGRVRRMDDLVAGIHRYSQAGRLIGNKTVIDLQKVVSEVISMLNPPGHVRISIEGTLPSVLCERASMEQILQNLIGNAIKYINRPDGRITISSAAEGNFWKTCVEDNGPGIAEKDHERIFQMFTVLQPRDKVEASGVGLAVVKKIIEMYGGKVWVESEVGKGSSFYFAIPK
ncbi:MAG: PAS domain-containing protein [Nitrospiraceae bacterium]|nr:MAG: PAS domain-containing protein [Nitrospiraceae bacterium]